MGQGQRSQLLIATFVAASVSCGAAVAGGRTYDNDDLKGSYHCITQKFNCGFSFVATYDGAGVSQNTEVVYGCPGMAGPTPFPNVPPFPYTVNPDGSFTVHDTLAGADAYGQITQNGQLLIFGGTNPLNPAFGVCIRK